MSELVVVVTGATDGIGKETARGLLATGAHVIVHGRNKPRVDAAVAALSAAVPTGHVEGISFDLGSMTAVRNGAAALLARLPRIDVLINNAGIFA
ncbi:MAG TPA: SDR family NAD(P)-dependent oxidoreductase, partial [Kofleriaceae bacterium]|nr:SDR family NAD(P)-dependent oxidoreductase [Kofleriaceae bacterium]